MAPDCDAPTKSNPGGSASPQDQSGKHDMSKNHSGHTAHSSSNSNNSPFMDIQDVDRLFRRASALAAVTYLLLITAVYQLAPAESFEKLEGTEANAAMGAFGIQSVAVCLIVFLPLGVLRNGVTVREKLSGIILAVLVVQSISIFTNALLASFPTPVMVDPVTHARVFLARWCEWIPLSALMTFLAETVHVPKEVERNSTKGKVKKEEELQDASGDLSVRIRASLCQSLSCVSGLCFPFLTDPYLWGVCMVSSCLFYFAVFFRVAAHHASFKRAKATRAKQRLMPESSTSYLQSEDLVRIAFGFYLVLSCSIVWTVLVTLYFANWMFILYLPPYHDLRHPSLAMVLDTFFDVLAKAVYMKLIVDVHKAVFDADVRTQHQLVQLRKLVSVLWNSVSDLVIISVQSEGKITTLLSPSFQTLVGGFSGLPKQESERKGALMLESVLSTSTKASATTSLPETRSFLSMAYVVESGEMTGFPMPNSSFKILGNLDITNHHVQQASSLSSAAWEAMAQKDLTSTTSSDDLLIYTITKTGGKEVRLEANVSRESPMAIVAVVRDVTERHLRFQAERRAHAETLARQRDAQSINRFTRHEVKNGLLALIELCDNLKLSFADVQRGQSPSDIAAVTHDRTEAPGDPPRMEGMSRYLKDLDLQLKETLATVTAEAMARDVIHQVYIPQLEPCSVQDVLVRSSADSANKKGFPLDIEPDMPDLLLDPQLIRYIHRNAVSNAVKYGRAGGVIKTGARYNAETAIFSIEIVNEPGFGHEELRALGSEATRAVFEEGRRLHYHLEVTSSSAAPGDTTNLSKIHVSSGDGAWIMQKCALTLRGECCIEFHRRETIFSFDCPAQPVVAAELSAARDFQVPPDTWGIGIDDSRIQRKLMGRILTSLGVDPSRVLILGENPDEIHALGGHLKAMFRKDTKCKFLVFMDENLDFRESDVKSTVLSGSLIMQDCLESLSPAKESRILALVRSANDSGKDVALYSSRTHGFFPKAPMKQDRTREMFAPMWAERFSNFVEGKPEEDDEELPSVVDDSASDSSAEIVKVEFARYVHSVDAYVQDNNLDHSKQNWEAVWSVLHSMKGDLMIIDESPSSIQLVQTIESMRGSHFPSDFMVHWTKIKELIPVCLQKGHT